MVRAPAFETVGAQHCVPIPATDVLSWAFNNGTASERKNNTPIWIDGQDVSNHLDADTAELTVKKLICGLRRSGLQQGDVVCVHSFNSIWYPVLYLAVIGAGGIFLGSNPAYKPSELERLFTASRAKFMIIEERLLDNVLPTTSKIGVSPECIFVLENASIHLAADSDTISVGAVNYQPLRTLLRYGEENWLSFDDLDRASNTPAVYLCSSGTTGLPKLVVMSHHAIVTQLALADYQVGEPPHEVYLDYHGSTPFALPFAILSLHRHESIFIMPRFSPSDVLTCIAQHKITMMPLVPPMARALFQAQSTTTDTKIDISSLTELICAGAPLSASNQRHLSSCIPPSCRLVQLWGMSETGWVTAFRYPDRDDEGGSIGRLLPNITAKLVDPITGKDMELIDGTEVGEIYVRTSGVMMGYLNNEAATQETLSSDERGRWLRTGDIARYDGGKWYIVDRVKDIIKVRGWQVSPTELEVCILNHPKVLDAAVIGVADEQSGEIPIACVVVDESTGSDHDGLASDIQAFMARNLASYKMLKKDGVMFVNEIPRGPSGKILRRLLREHVHMHRY